MNTCMIKFTLFIPQTALHLATHTQQLEIMRKLLIAGASINITDHKGNTPLHIAARFSSTRPLEEISHYVSLQTILEVAQVRNNEGQSCVHVAAKNGNSELLRKLKSLGIDVNMQVHTSLQPHELMCSTPCHTVLFHCCPKVSHSFDQFPCTINVFSLPFYNRVVLFHFIYTYWQYF